MGKLTVKWERSIYDEEPHEFVRELAEFLPLLLHEYDCAAMLAMRVKMGDDAWQSRRQFEQFCANTAAVDWLGEEIAVTAGRALAKWNSGDFTKESGDNGKE